MVRLYRGQAEAGSGPGVPDWVKESPKFKATQNATGRWWTQDPSIAQWYVKDAGETGHLTYIDVPAEVAESARVRNNPEAVKFSIDPDSELFLPEQYAGKGKKAETPAAAPADSGVDANVDAIRKQFQALDAHAKADFDAVLDKGAPFTTEELFAVAKKLGVKPEGKTRADAAAAVARALWVEFKRSTK